MWRMKQRLKNVLCGSAKEARSHQADDGRKSAPFIFTELTLLGQAMRLMTHRQDAVLSAMLRNEIALCPFYLAELAWLRDNIRPDAFVLDAGGNIGSVSLALSLREASATLVSFEPDPLNFALLQANLVLNARHNIYAFNMALGREDGLIHLYRSPFNYGDHRTSKPKGIDLRENEFASFPTPIPRVRASRFVCEAFPSRRFDLAKIDTQGADFEILGDILPLLSSDAKVAIEYSPYHLDTNGTKRDEVLDVVSSFKRIERINPNANTLYSVEEISKDELARFFDAERERYRTHYDIVLHR